MSDYQAVYDAVSRALSGVRSAIRDAADMAASNAAQSAHEASVEARTQAQVIAIEMTRPSVIYRPSIAPDGNKWGVLYGDDLATGVSGWGDTPAEAMADFDAQWTKARSS